MQYRYFLKARLPLSLWLAIMLSLPNFASELTDNEPIKAAGIIAYTIESQQTQLLLANHTGLGYLRGYAAFGGARESHETAEQAALREFHEETRCAFIHDNIQLNAKASIQRGRYIGYIIEIPYVSAAELLSRQQASGCRGGTYAERGPLQWYKLSMPQERTHKLDKLMLNPPWHIWQASQEVIEAAIKLHLIPVH